MQQEVKKKKILYVITKSNWGGAQRYVYDLATNLPKVTFEVVVAFGGKGELELKLKEAGIRTISIPHLERDIGIFKDVASCFALLKIFKSENPDIVHLNSSKVGGLGAFAGRLAGVKKIIFTAHGWAFNEERGGASKSVIWLFSWITALLCHKIITVSDYDRRQGERMPFFKHKIVRIYNGVGKIKFTAKLAAREHLLGEHAASLKKAFWIGTIAELHNNKGLRYAIEACSLFAKNMPGEKFVFVMIGDGEERAALEAGIQKTGLQNNVLLVGKKPDAAVLLKAFDIFLLPSVKEGLPYVILEAGSAELPVIATASGGIPEVVSDMYSGILIKKRSPVEILRAIEFLSQNKEKQKEFGSALKKTIYNDFSLKTMVKITVATYTA